MLDTNILSDLVRRPHGQIADRIKRVGERRVRTSIIVAAELRYGAAKKGSSRLKKATRTMTRQARIQRSGIGKREGGRVVYYVPLGGTHST
jgi:predicted nucleic acid-binding protein